MTVRRPVILVARPDGPPPVGLDALVVEDDRELILGAAPSVRDPGSDLGTLASAMGAARVWPPGTLVLRGRRPLRMHAVVHDLEEEPSWDAEWVAQALAEAFEVAGQQRMKALAMPLLGRVHGRVPESASVAMLAAALDGARCSHLQRLWLMTRPRVDPGEDFAPLIDAGYRLLQLWEGRVE